MIAVAYLIIKQAQLKKESVGLHYSLDYPAPPKAKEF
jgi:L-aspartate oxidase